MQFFPEKVDSVFLHERRPDKVCVLRKIRDLVPVFLPGTGEQ